MKTYLLISAIYLLGHICSAQFYDDFGVFLQGNAATQLVRNPQRPEDGVFSWNYTKTWGTGLFGVNYLGDGFSVRNSLGYVQKGFRDDFQLLNNGMFLASFSSRNILHYVNVEALMQKSWREGFFRPYVMGGLSFLVLVGRDLADEIINPQGISTIELDEYNRLGLSGILALGANIGEEWFLELGINLDLLPAQKQPDTSIKNSLWFLRVGYLFNK